MIPGIAAQQSGAAAPATGPGPAAAVNFNGSTTLRLSSLSCTNNGFLSLAFWINIDWASHHNSTLLSTNPANWYDPSFYWFGTTPGPSILMSPQIGGGGEISMRITNYAHAWQNYIISVNVNQPATHKIFKAYVNDIDSSTPYGFGANRTTDTTAAFNNNMNGWDIWIGGDSFGLGDCFVGDMCDVSIWPGVSFLNTAGDIDVSHRRLFIDAGGHRVDPSVAIAALGHPAIMLSGNATNFPTNSLGTGGAFTVNNGALSNATTSPP